MLGGWVWSISDFCRSAGTRLPRFRHRNDRPPPTNGLLTLDLSQKVCDTSMEVGVSHGDCLMAKGLTGNAVAYIRVSTGKQAKSGLGLEAQIEAIRAFAKAEGYKITGTFEEHES